jgi:protein arginine kinase activator
MKCSQCKTNEASVHFSATVNGKSMDLELCVDCAKTSGLELFTSPFNFAANPPPALNDVMDLLSNWASKSDQKAATRTACPACHWTMADFQKTGRMGCAECYLHFETETANILKKVQGSLSHKGKKAPAEVAKTKVRDREKTLARLRSDLKKAVETENYEKATSLRDEIQAFEKGTHDEN